MRKNDITVRNDWGFTILELMVVLVVVSVLIGVGGTFLHRIQPNLKLNGAADQLYGDLNNARMAAVRRNAVVVIDWHSNLASENNLAYGYDIFVDFNRNGNMDQEDIPLAHYISPRGIVDDSDSPVKLAFDPRGYFGVLSGGQVVINGPRDLVIKKADANEPKDYRAVLIYPVGTMKYFRNSYDTQPEDGGSLQGP